MDIADLYDYEIERIPPVWQKLMHEFSTKTNTRANLDELAKRAAEEFLKAGLIVEVNSAPTLIINPNTMQPGMPEIVIIGRVDSLDDAEYDHERKRHEVLRSKERGEAYYGQKEKSHG